MRRSGTSCSGTLTEWRAVPVAKSIDRRHADADGVGGAGALDQLGELVDERPRSCRARSGRRVGSESVVPSSTATETFVPPTSTPMNRCAIAPAPSHAERSAAWTGYCRDRCRLARPPTTRSWSSARARATRRRSRALVRRYSPMLLRLARMYVPTDALAEDVVQETWVAVVRGPGALRGPLVVQDLALPDPGQPRQDARRARAPLDPVRLGRRRRADEDGDEGPTVDPARFTSEGAWTSRAGRLARRPGGRAGLAPRRCGSPREAIDELPERQKIVITLRDLEGLSSDEVRNALGPHARPTSESSCTGRAPKCARRWRTGSPS